MAFFNKKNDEIVKSNFNNNVSNNKNNVDSKDDVFDEEFLNIIESKEDKNNDKNNHFFVEDKDFEVVKNSIDDLKQQILRLQEIMIQHINSSSTNKNTDVSNNNSAFSAAVFKAISDLHENVFENKKKLKSLDEKLSNLIDIYKDEVEVLKELNENLKKISFNSNSNDKDKKS